jgi:hypothetical protein
VAMPERLRLLGDPCRDPKREAWRDPTLDTWKQRHRESETERPKDRERQRDRQSRDRPSLKLITLMLVMIWPIAYKVSNIKSAIQSQQIERRRIRQISMHETFNLHVGNDMAFA